VFIYYRLEEPILYSLWGVAEGFFSYNSPVLNGSGRNLRYKWGATVHTHTKIGGNFPWVQLMLPKCVLFFLSVMQPMRTFGHLSCSNFDHFWNKRHDSVYACIHWWKISDFLCSGFSRPQKQLKGVISRGCLWWGLQLKWHNFGWWESFWELVDIPRMCLLYVSFGGGRMVYALWGLILAISADDIYRTDCAQQLSMMSSSVQRHFSSLHFSESPDPLQPV